MRFLHANKITSDVIPRRTTYVSVTAELQSVATYVSVNVEPVPEAHHNSSARNYGMETPRRLPITSASCVNYRHF
jgi:hypothetical protein